MAHINISFESQELNTESGQHLATFLASLKQLPRPYCGEPVEGNLVVVKESVEPTTEEKPKATRNRSKKVEEVKEEPIDQEAVNEIETTTEPEDDDLDGPAESKKVTLQEIRSLVFEKKDTHKDTIKAELSRIGAASIPTIEEKDYGHFYSFLLRLT